MITTPVQNNKAEAFLSRGAQVIVRMRGLPFSCTARQVVDFFASTITNSDSDTSKAHSHSSKRNQSNANRGRVLKPSQVFGGEEGVLFVKNHDDKPTGDAFVLFANEDEAQRAIAKHHENIGARYVELFRSSISEVQQVLSLSAASESQASIKIGAKSAALNGESRALSATSQGSKSSSNTKQQQDVKTRSNSNSQHATYAQVANNICKLDSAAHASSQQQQEDNTTTSKPQTSLNDTDQAPQVESASKGSETSAPVDCCATQQVRVEQELPDALGEPSSPSDVSQQDSSSPKDTTTCSSSSAASSASSSSCTRPQSYTKRHHQNLRTPAHYTNQQHYQRSHNNHLNYQQHSLANGQAAAAAAAAATAAAYAAQAYQQQVAYAAMLQQQPLAAHQYQAGYHATLHCYAPPGGYINQPAADNFGTPTSVPASSGAETSARNCVRLRGLPYEAQTEHVIAFLGKHSENILLQGVHMVYGAQGQPTGEAIIQMNSQAAAVAAAREVHKRVMQIGKKQRYIEVTPSSLDELRPALGHGVTAAFAASARLATGYAFPPPHYSHALMAPVVNAGAGSLASPVSSSPEVTSGCEQSSSSSASSSTETSEMATIERANRNADSAQVAAATYYYHPAHYMYYYPPPLQQQQQHNLVPKLLSCDAQPVDGHLHQAHS